MELLQFSNLKNVPELRHAVTTRDGGVSDKGPKGDGFKSLNLAYHVDDWAFNVRENRLRLAKEAGFDGDRLISCKQVHGDHIQIVYDDDNGLAPRNDDAGVFVADAMTTANRGLPLLILVADCTPILLVDPVHHALAVVHAGWRGALARIASKAVREMEQFFDTNPTDVLVGIGPCLSIKNLEVGLEVAEQVAAVDPLAVIEGYEKPHLDLRGLIERDLYSVGISAANIETMPYCTFDDERFFSHRRQKGNAGRFGIVAWWEN